MALHFTKVLFAMHSAFATIGHLPICQEYVFAVQFSPQTMLCHVQPEESQSFGSLLTEVCHDVCIEPRLQPLSGETLSTRNATTEGNARLDVAASGFWGGRFERAFFDVRVFNPYAPSNRTLQTAACIGGMNVRRGASMKNEYAKWSTPPLFP